MVPGNEDDKSSMKNVRGSYVNRIRYKNKNINLIVPSAVPQSAQESRVRMRDLNPFKYHLDNDKEKLDNYAKELKKSRSLVHISKVDRLGMHFDVA